MEKMAKIRADVADIIKEIEKRLSRIQADSRVSFLAELSGAVTAMFRVQAQHDGKTFAAEISRASDECDGEFYPPGT